MKILGLSIKRDRKSTFGLSISRDRNQKALTSVLSSSRGGWFTIFDSFTGAWQQDVEVDRDAVLAFSSVYACVTLIAADIGKMRVKLVEQQPSGIWKEIRNGAHSPVLRKPNRYQTRIKFFEYWITSKLIHGNVYVLKQRDARRVVTGLYILDPCRVTPLVDDEGGVWYQLGNDNLSNIEQKVIVPASEIIHDTMVCLHHPLIGVSPIFACGLAATQGLKIQNNSAKFFENMSRPSGLLTAPGAIATDTATRLKAAWEENFTGDNIGKVAVLGDGLRYEAMTITPVDAQLIDQLKWSAETVCSCFHVPPYMIGVGTAPTYNNIEALNQQYYTQCLQSLIESIEICLDEGLELEANRGVEFDLDSLLRMDTATRYKSHKEAISGGFLAPNEARVKEDLAPVDGGDSPMLQQQNYSLAALAKRDAKEDPFATASKPETKPGPVEEPEKPEVDETEKALLLLNMRSPEMIVHA